LALHIFTKGIKSKQDEAFNLAQRLLLISLIGFIAASLVSVIHLQHITQIKDLMYIQVCVMLAVQAMMTLYFYITSIRLRELANSKSLTESSKQEIYHVCCLKYEF
jgi:cytochrome bd-type quinol oxidase subunit 2